MSNIPEQISAFNKRPNTSKQANPDKLHNHFKSTSLNPFFLMNKTICDRISQHPFTSEESFNQFLEDTLSSQLSFDLSANRIPPTKLIFESQMFRLTQPLSNIIERYCVLTNLSILCYATQ